MGKKLLQCWKNANEIIYFLIFMITAVINMLYT